MGDPCGRVEMFACVALAHGDHVGVHQAAGKVHVDITCSTSGLSTLPQAPWAWPSGTWPPVLREHRSGAGLELFR